jgi:putative tricarboxylic transport membrane protein
VQRSDRWVGLGLALLALAVLWSARAFPPVPGQKLGAAFLPMLIGAGLLLCGITLIVRDLHRGRAGGHGLAAPPAGSERKAEHFGSSAVIIAAVVFYIVLSERLGFLLIAPLCLLAVFLALRIRWQTALLWALAGTALVHLGFYRLLRVPLPWGLLNPFY